MKVGIIDSFGGFNHEFFVNKEIKQLNLGKRNSMSANGLTHAELVSSLIFRESKINEIYLINILNENNKSTLDLLIKAIEKLITENINIINISLGIENKNLNITQLKKVCDKAFRHGITIVAAYNNKNTITYPAAFKNVIGVATDEKLLDLNKLYEVNILKNNIVFSCNMCSVTHLNMKGFIRGNSYLTGIITGFISNLIYNNIKSQREILSFFKTLDKHLGDDIFMFMNNDFNSFKSIYIYEEFNDNFCYKNNNIIKRININDSLLVKQLENEIDNFTVLIFGVKDYKNINIINQILNILSKVSEQKKVIFRYPVLSIYERYRFYNKFGIPINCLSI